MHDDLIPRGWATERHFAESLAIGQITPGPTGLWVIGLVLLIAVPIAIGTAIYLEEYAPDSRLTRSNASRIEVLLPRPPPML